MRDYLIKRPETGLMARALYNSLRILFWGMVVVAVTFFASLFNNEIWAVNLLAFGASRNVLITVIQSFSLFFASSALMQFAYRYEQLQKRLIKRPVQLSEKSKRAVRMRVQDAREIGATTTRLIKGQNFRTLNSPRGSA